MCVISSHLCCCCVHSFPNSFNLQQRIMQWTQPSCCWKRRVQKSRRIKSLHSNARRAILLSIMPPARTTLSSQSSYWKSSMWTIRCWRYVGSLFHVQSLTISHAFQAKNNDSRTALMEAGRMCALRITKAILEKVREQELNTIALLDHTNWTLAFVCIPSRDILQQMLTMKCDSNQSAIHYAIRSPHKNSERCAKIIIHYYSAGSDVEEIFLPCLRLGDVQLAKVFVIVSLLESNSNDTFNHGFFVDMVFS